MENNIMQLPDGRPLSYALYGPPNGKPVLYFHGTPSSRLEPLVATIYGIDVEQLLQQNNLRLIAVDRPGMGLSAFDKNKSFISFARDARALLQHLHIESCSVLCWSGGGPYALAMASIFPDILKSVYMVAGISSSFGDEEVIDKMGWNKMYFNTARKAPLLLKGMLEAVKRTTLCTPISQSLYDLSNADYALLKDVDRANALLQATIKEAVVNGMDGAVQEAQLYFEPFGFALQQVQTPVHFWWGTDDNIVMYIHAKRLEQQLPHAMPHYKAGEGHVSVYVHWLHEVLQTISAAL